MKIAQIRTRPVHLPYLEPLKTASNYFDVAEGLLIEIATDGGERGYGYAELFPRVGETLSTAQSIIEELLAPMVMGKDPSDVKLHVELMEKKLAGNRRAKAAVEMALQDLRGKASRLPVYELLGGKARSKVTVLRMVSLREPEEMAQEASALVQKGIKALKLKIGTGWKKDVERVRRVREAVGDEVFIKVDANQAYKFDEALRVARLLEPLEVRTFEQPLPAEDWEGMVELTKKSPVPVEADQTVRSVADVLRAIRLGAARVINTSPQKVGSILGAKCIADLCEAAGIPCILSNVGGSLLNDAAAIQVVAASFSTHLPCEVGEFERVTRDPANGLKVLDGEIHIPTASGLGVNVVFPE